MIFFNTLIMRSVVLLVLAFVPFLNLTAQRIQKCQNGMYGLAVSKNNGDVKWVAKPKYTDINNNGNGSFAVRDKSGRWGVVTSAGKEVVPCKYESIVRANEAYRYYLNPSAKNYASNITEEKSDVLFPDFTLTRDYTGYIKSYVEAKVNAWQKKGEFEKTADYQKRVTEYSRKAMIEKYTAEACEECLKKAQNKELRMALKEYDADNETFLVNTSIGQFVLPVSIDKAPQFKKDWPRIASENTYDIVDGRIILRSAVFSMNGKVRAVYDDQNHALYAQANIRYNFDPIEVPLTGDRPAGQPVISSNLIEVGKSDIDVDIPSVASNRNNTFALIFSNENYREEVPVKYAINDGSSVEKYFNLTLGIPAKNIHFIKDATKNDMIREIDWLKDVAKAYDNNIDLLVYYAGHGSPDESDGSAYLVPVDGVATNTKTLFPLSDFYTELGGISSKRALVFLDACFSGATRGSGMLAAARGIAIKAKQTSPQDNMVVMTAATGDETAWPYEEKGHGLFTYFLLKELQSTRGDVTLKRLTDYVIEEVSRHSVVVNSKKQTPTVSVSSALSDSWTEIKLK